jgi:formylglycine-generating enzyme required for sulfatase activity
VRGFVVAAVLALLGWGAYEVHGRLQAHALRGRLLDAKTDEVPAIVADMAPYRRWLDPLLHDAYAQAEKDHDRSRLLHASLALLPVDATQVEYLYGRLLGAQPHEVPVIRDFLAPHKAELLGRLWAVVERPAPGKKQQRLRAAAALAKYDPHSRRWERARAAVANDLVGVPLVYLVPWMESFRPVRAQLRTPLAAIFREGKPERTAERTLAANLLADYAADQPQDLADLLMDADARQFAILFPKLQEQGQRGRAVLTAEIDKQLPPDLPSSHSRREELAKRQANAAVALLRMNHPEKVWPLLRRSDRPDDPRVRSYLIHRLGPLGADAGTLLRRLGEERDVAIRRALLLSLGPEEFGKEAWTPGQKEKLLGRLRELYRTADDPGVHGAAEWLLRQWGQGAWLERANDQWARDKAQREKRLESIRQLLARGKEKTPPQWYVTGQGQTMVVVPGPVEFLMGSPATEDGRLGEEVQYRRRIGRTFALAARPVTVREFHRFLQAQPGLAKLFKGDAALIKRYSPEANCPIITVDWYMAAAYCNWLSQQEGLPEAEWCYEANPKGQYWEGMKLRPGYLSLKGYRLPTEAEWEYACRAGAVTSRSYGETEELLGRYGWHLKNAGERTFPAGAKKPNDLGLFDMHGNVWSWCQNVYRPYPAQGGRDDIEDTLSINNQESRVLCGGSFDLRAVNLRSASRSRDVPTDRNINVGLRPARTFAP